MTENPTPNNQPQLTERDAELLSAYIDDMLTDDERTALEARLSTEPFLARELAAMRQTVAWINTLPTMQAPRNFTLTIEQAEAIRPAAATKASDNPKTTGPAPSPESKRILQFPVSASWAIGSAAALIVVVFGAVILLNSGNFTTGGEAGIVNAPETLESAEIAQQATATPITSPTLLATSRPQGGGAGTITEPTKEPAIVTPMTNTGGAVPETAAESSNIIQATPTFSSTTTTLNDDADADTDEAAEFDTAAADSAQDDSTDAPIAEASSDDEDVASDFDDEGVTEVQAVEEAEIVEEEALEADAADADFEEETLEAESTEVLVTADDAARSTGAEAMAEVVSSPLQNFVDFVITFLTTLTEILNR